MKLLILTQYYPPEIGAPQNRLHELAVRLQDKGVQVEVLTALPNYPKMEIMDAYRNGKGREEHIDGIAVHRSWIYVSKSKGIFARLLTYFSFVWSSYWRGRTLKDVDFLLVESPPLFLGYSAMALAKKLNAKLIFNVSDLWPESAEKLGIVQNRLFLNLAYRLEARCYQKAAFVSGQTQGIVADIQRRFPTKAVYWLPNGVNCTYYDPAQIDAGDWRESKGFAQEELLFFYGGILGYAQGLDVILHAAKQLENTPKVQFILQGAGPEKDRLLQLKADLKLTNVHFLEPVQKDQMPTILKAIDVALVPLRKLPLFEGAIPSKVFEALSMEVPLLLGVDGEARMHFIERAQAGWYFEPENVSALVQCIESMLAEPEQVALYGKNARQYVRQHFNRDVIAAQFYEQLSSMLCK
ncbi:MAG: hypothetical protein RLZZ301_1212 [Bacteroidota bacterium]|jgi:glycosyltransferase involved in cell wall biosynthesis